LQRKLEAKGHEAGEVSSLIDTLAAQSLQSDARYAEVYIRSRASRGYGPRRIALELKQRGLPAEVAEAALAESECDWFALARRADRKKFGESPGRSSLEFARRRQHLEYRGFAAEQIKATLASVQEPD
jgi:regulatory protein